VARPRLKLDEAAIGDLAYIGCSTNEIALIVGCDDQTLHNRFSKLLAKKRAERRRDLRQLQLEAARSKNPAMLIWLGKQELDQVETKPAPEQSNLFLDAMDLASSQHDRADGGTPGPGPQ